MIAKGDYTGMLLRNTTPPGRERQILKASRKRRQVIDKRSVMKVWSTAMLGPSRSFKIVSIKYTVAPPLSKEDHFKTPWTPETADSTEPDMHYVFFL